MSSATEHPAFHRSQWQNVTGSREIPWLRRCVGQHFDCSRTILSTDTGGLHIASINGDGIRSPFAVFINHRHRWQAKPIEIATWHRNADVPTRPTNHEGHLFRRCTLGGKNQVTFVLAILIVHDNNTLAVTKCGNGILDGIKSNSHVLL
jgi:hypothetical protein